MRDFLRGPGGFVLLLLVLRALFLLATLDPSQERVMEVIEFVAPGWAHGPERPLYDREELYTGTAAEAIRAHLPLPLAIYRFMPYASGSLLLSLLAAPLFALFGPHYFVLKMIALAVTLLGGLSWFLVVRRWLGSAAAGLFGALYLLAPTVLVRTALIAKGDHPEAMALLGACAYLGTRAIQTSAPRARSAWSAAAGLLAGLSVYVSYGCVPALAGIGLVALAATRGRPWRAWAAFGGGLLLGLIPWLIVLIQSSGAAVEIYGKTPGSSLDLAEAWRRALGLFGQGFSAGYDLPGSLARFAGAMLWLIAVLLGWVALARPGRRAPAAAVLAGTGAHLAAFCLLAPDASSRYLLPCYPLLLMAAVWGALPRDLPQRISASWLRARGGRAGRMLLALLLVIGLAAQAVAVADSCFPAIQPPLAGFDWPLFGAINGAKLGPAEILRCPPAARPYLATGFGRRVAFAADPTRYAEAAAMIGPAHEARVWEGAGVALIEGWRLSQAAALLATLPPEARTSLLRGMARYADFYLAHLAATRGVPAVEALLAEFDPAGRAALAAPLARALAIYAVHGIRSPAAAPGGDEGAAGGRASGAAGESSILEGIVARESRGALERLTGAQELLRGTGYALYRDMRSGRGLRFWRTPEDTWAAPAAAQARAREGPPALWQGVALAFERDLAIRSPSWLAGPGADGRLAGLLERITRGLPEAAAAPFYEAAGRVCAWAARNPSLPAGLAPPMPVSPSRAVPPALRAAYESGLATDLGPDLE